MLNDFIASLPIDVIRRVEIEDEKIFIPSKIDANEFYKKYREEVESTQGLTEEKAIYLASTVTPKPRKSIPELLIRGR